MENESFKTVEPDIEIVVRSGEQEIAVLGFFQNKRSVWDVLIGVDERNRRDQLISLFELAVASIQAATFSQIRDATRTQLSFLDEEPAQPYYEQEKEADPKKR